MERKININMEEHLKKTNIMNRVLREYQIRVNQADGCRIPRLYTSVNNFSQLELIYFYDLLTKKEREEIQIPLWIKSNIDSGVGIGTHYGTSFVNGKGYGSKHNSNGSGYGYGNYGNTVSNGSGSSHLFNDLFIEKGLENFDKNLSLI
jgi:hypothetical protein